jgi:hypothetical protein
MPVFVVGFPRSGTTLCQRLVAERFNLPTLPETHFFEALAASGPISGQINQARARALVETLAGYLPMDVAQQLATLKADPVRTRGLFLNIVAEQLGDTKLARSLFWLEKTPGHARHMAAIARMFPQVRFIYMLRHPALAFASRRDLAEPGKGWGEPWRPVEAMCRQWAGFLESARQFDASHPGRVLYVRLEDLSRDSDLQLERIGEFLGLEAAEAPSEVAAERIVRPFEAWKTDALQAQDPAIAQRAGKSVLDAYDLWRVHALLEPQLAELGYDEAAPSAPHLDALHRKLMRSIDYYRHKRD